MVQAAKGARPKKARQCLWGCNLSLRHFPSSLFVKSQSQTQSFFFFQILSFLFFNLFFKQTQFLLKSRAAPFENQSVSVFTTHCSHVSRFSISVTKYHSPTPQKINLKEESFILAPGFRDFYPWLAGAFVLGTVVKQNFPTEGNGR